MRADFLSLLVWTLFKLLTYANIVTLCDKNDHMCLHVWPHVIACATTSDCMWPHVIAYVTASNKCDHMWYMWPYVTHNLPKWLVWPMNCGGSFVAFLGFQLVIKKGNQAKNWWYMYCAISKIGIFWGKISLISTIFLSWGGYYGEMCTISFWPDSPFLIYFRSETQQNFSPN